MSMSKYDVSVIGLGYIGLPTAALLADEGRLVSGVDVSEAVVTTVGAGRAHFAEPDLATVVSRVIKDGRLSVFNKPQRARTHIICVPTPVELVDGHHQPNLEAVMAAADMLLSVIEHGDLVILESTSPVGTADSLYEYLSERCAVGTQPLVAYCPERVLPGNILRELKQNDRVVGGVCEEATTKAAEFYSQFTTGAILPTDARTAELCKLAENSFRDVNIAYANELSVICAEQGVDVFELITLTNRHPRVNILQPGVGVGGHCIAVDPWFIVAQNPSLTKLIRKAREVNDGKPEWVASRIKEEAENRERYSGFKPKIACLGITFKADADDLRGSPALQVAGILRNDGYEVVVVDSNVQSHAAWQITPLENVLSREFLLAVLVPHKEFKGADLVEILRDMRALNFCGTFRAT